ncbi:alkaline phosphatase-like [Onthophagus taurus]|uniref:alkaline phosphatase-like n=1 Tax=Onthophagus taurus TaxID=166361 RepID=UPI000C200E3A|nr:alkaline phosphatase-like [Onthophagus taurus]
MLIRITMGKLTVVLIAIFASTLANIIPQEHLEDDDSYMHSYEPISRGPYAIIPEETNAKYWTDLAKETIKKKLNTPINTNVAKNIIMFLGDGMSIPTLKAARVYNGQIGGFDGEGVPLSFEEFPYSGLSKTYCLNTQVPDSACTATAYLCGVKAIHGTIGVDGRVTKSDCDASLDESTHVYSIAKWSQEQGKRTGIVTTTRVTHASPAGAYAHTANRDWEAYGDGPAACPDIADQLIHGETGKNFDVILGGGRRAFIPNTLTDEEGSKGKRQDGRNLIEEWKDINGDNAHYVWNRDDLLNLPSNTSKILGLFESSHCVYNLETTDKEPSLEEMTVSAIELLSKKGDGYFLFVEGGRIDHAHHDTRAHKALDETVQFSKAIQRARDITSEEDTLIVVTSDHAHVMNVNGYANRGNNIFGVGGKGSDGIPYLTLSYGNGPGHRNDVNGARYDVSNDNTNDKNYEFPALAPLGSETHGGDDVGVFASGPWAHLFSGVIQQNVIPHTMAFAACVGDGPTACD